MAAPPTRTPRVGNSSRRHGIHGFLLVTTSVSGRAGGGDLPRRTALVPTPTRETVPVVHPFLVALRQQSRDVPSLGFAGALSRAKKKRDARQPSPRADKARCAPRRRPLRSARPQRQSPAPMRQDRHHGPRRPPANYEPKDERKGRGGKGERGERTSAISSHAAVAIAYMLRRSAAVS